MSESLVPLVSLLSAAFVLLAASDLFRSRTKVVRTHEGYVEQRGR